MIFYVMGEEKFYVVKTLKAKEVGAMVITDALIDEYEPLTAEVDLNGYATEEFVEEQIAAIEYPQYDDTEVKERLDALEEINHDEFLKEHQDISHLATKEEVEKLHQRRYEVSGVPEGTLVKYFDNEVRVMCPKDAEFHKQNVGAGGSPNKYYMNFTMFAPEGAVTFREGTQGMTAEELVLEDELRTVVNGQRTIWLSLAVFDEATGEWTYRGDESTVDRCIGWNVLVEWYDAEGKVIIRDSFRVNIANEKCFDSVVPLYREGLATKEFVEEQIAAIELKEGPQGEAGQDGKDGAQGPAGQDGVSIVNVTIEGNRLKVELSNGQILDAGELPAGQGGGGAVNPELEKELAETKQQLLDLTYGVEYEYIYFDVQDSAAETDLKFDPVTAPKFFEEYNAAIDAGQDEDFIMSMYEQDIYRMYILRPASDHRIMNRYEMIPIEDSSVQPKNNYISSWNPVKNISSWNWTGDTDGGFTINQGPTSAMVFAFMKVKEEYRGKF
jgi:hypothetical protein